MPVSAASEQAAELFKLGKFQEAARVVSEAIADGESADLWNDWAVAQFGMGELEDAERALRRALSLEAENRQTAENLGALLASQNRLREAIPLLERALEGAEEPVRTTLSTLLEECERAENAASATDADDVAKEPSQRGQAGG